MQIYLIPDNNKKARRILVVLLGLCSLTVFILSGQFHALIDSILCFRSVLFSDFNIHSKILTLCIPH